MICTKITRNWLFIRFDPEENGGEEKTRRNGERIDDIDQLREE